MANFLQETQRFIRLSARAKTQSNPEPLRTRALGPPIKFSLRLHRCSGTRVVFARPSWPIGADGTIPCDAEVLGDFSRVLVFQ